MLKFRSFLRTLSHRPESPVEISTLSNKQLIHLLRTFPVYTRVARAAANELKIRAQTSKDSVALREHSDAPLESSLLDENQHYAGAIPAKPSTDELKSAESF